MKFSRSSLFCYLASAGVRSVVAATNTIGDKVGAGGENTMSFSLSYANADGSVCTPCALCEGSSLNNVFTTNAASLCISCTDESACDEAIVMSSFKKAWGMTYASLTSHEGDAISDPESIAILGSDDYDEGSKTGSWTVLATSSSDVLFTKRNEPFDVVVDNDALYAHYRFVFNIKDNSKPMKIGHIGVVESCLKMYSVELFEKLTESKVGGLPSKAPTAAPTYPVGPVFTNESLKTAVNEWTANRPDALEKYGEMKYWGTSKVTSMKELFFKKNNFNEDLSLWDTSSVSDMIATFHSAAKFNANISQWNVSQVNYFSSMFVNAAALDQKLCWTLMEGAEIDYMFFGNSPGTTDC